MNGGCVTAGKKTIDNRTQARKFFNDLSNTVSELEERNLSNLGNSVLAKSLSVFPDQWDVKIVVTCIHTHKHTHTHTHNTTHILFMTHSGHKNMTFLSRKLRILMLCFNYLAISDTIIINEIIWIVFAHPEICSMCVQWVVVSLIIVQYKKRLFFKNLLLLITQLSSAGTIYEQQWIYCA